MPKVLVRRDLVSAAEASAEAWTNDPERFKNLEAQRDEAQAEIAEIERSQREQARRYPPRFYR
jgi:hypothetical protein